MTTIHTIARFGLAGLATSLALVTLPATAQEGVAVKNLLGSIGVISPEKDPIRYRERAPLVLPPKMQLRDPAASGRMASADPAWPKDADVESKRRVSDEQRRPVTESEIRLMSERNPRMSAEDMRLGRTAGLTEGTRVDQRSHRGDSARDALYLSPQEMVGKAKPDAEPGDIGTEPQRKALSEPPSGLRKPTRRLEAAAATPRIDQQERDANPMNWLTRKFKGESDDE